MFRERTLSTTQTHLNKSHSSIDNVQIRNQLKWYRIRLIALKLGVRIPCYPGLFYFLFLNNYYFLAFNFLNAASSFKSFYADLKYICHLFNSLKYVYIIKLTVPHEPTCSLVRKEASNRLSRAFYIAILAWPPTTGFSSFIKPRRQ